MPHTILFTDETEEGRLLEEETLESETSEIVWVKIAMKGYKNLYIGCCYRPKIDDTTFLDNLSSSLQQITSKDSSSVLIGGDFNLPGWDW